MHLGLHRLLARKGQQMAHKASRAICILLDGHHILEARVCWPHLGQQQIGKADNGGEHVVEVMRQAR